MHWLFSYLKSLWGLIERIFIWFSRLFSKSPSLSKGIWRVVPYLFVIIVAVVLAILQTYDVWPFSMDGVEHIFDNQDIWGPYFTNNIYWSTIWLLFVAAFVLVRYLISLLSIETVAPYPDIIDAWAEGMDALDRAGMDMQNCPVFLILGLTHDDEQAFQTQTEANWRDVRPALIDREAPLRFWLHNDDAIYISLPGACATSRQAEKPPLGGGIQHSRASASPAPSFTGTILPENSPMMQQGPPKNILGTMVMPETPQYPAAPIGGIERTLTADDAERVRQALSEETLTPDKLPQLKEHPPALTPPEIDECRDRLKFVCSLAIRERGLLSPINGAAVMMPIQYAWPETPMEIKGTKQDLDILQSQFELLFPIVYLYSGMEKLPGLPDFIRRGAGLNSRFALARGGARFSMGNPVDEDNSSIVIDKGVQWFRDWIFKAFERDLNSPDNRKLFQFLRSVEARREELCRWLLQTFPKSPDTEPARLAGCYYCANGRAAANSGFLPGALNRFLEQDEDGEFLENKVSWIPQKHYRDRVQRRWAAFLFFVSVLLLAGAAAIVIYLKYFL